MATAEAEADTERLTGPQIVALAKAISVDKMTTIALNYLRLSKAKVRNITADFPGDAEAQSREMLWTWANKNPDNQVTNLADLLYQAADDGDVNSNDVLDILKVHRAKQIKRKTSVSAAHGKPYYQTESVTKEPQKSAGHTFTESWRSDHLLLGITKKYLKDSRQINIVEALFKTRKSISSKRVSVNIPEGVYGAILGKVYENSSPFRSYFPDLKCIGNVLEFCLLNVFKLAEQSWFTIAVPVENIDYIKGKLKLWHIEGDTRIATDAELLEAEEKPTRLCDTAYYKFTSNGLEIFTHRFSQFVLTSEGCHRQVKLLVFTADEQHAIYLRFYLCSLYYENGDYEQKIISKEKAENRKLAESKILHISDKDYDPSRSFLEIALKDSRSPMRLSLDEALNFDGQHICRSPPSQLPSFPLKYGESNSIELELKFEVSSGRGRKRKPRTEQLSFNIESKGFRSPHAEVPHCAASIAGPPIPQTRVLMSKSGGGGLTKRQCTLLAEEISHINMETIAQEYLDIDAEEIQSIKQDNFYRTVPSNRDMFWKWANRAVNRGPDQTKKLAHILYEAADDGDYIDPVKIQAILGFTKEQANMPQL